MAFIQNIAIAAVVLLALSVNAEDTTSATTTKPATPEVKMSCVDAESIAFDAAQMIGVWYGAASYPASESTMACAKVNIAAIANSTEVAVHLTFASDSKHLWVNQTVMANVAVPEPNKPTKAGYNITFSINNTSWPMETLKLLATDYKNYAIACGYKNAADNATDFGVVLTRERMLNTTVIGQYGEMASNYSIFQNSSMSPITQTAECLGKNGAASTLPFLSAIMAVIYALFMLTN